MPCPRVSIIIPVFNKIELTRACLRAVRSNTPSDLFEIIIVDNASTDGTQVFLKEEAADARVIRNQVNRGFAGACNQGARAARGDCLLFLNNDTEPRPGWLEPLLQILDNDPEVAAAGSKLLYPDGTIQHAGIRIVQDHPSSDLLRGVNAHQGRPSDFPLANHPLSVQALTAASLLIRASAFLEAGGFDEEYWNGYEDVDLCFKLQEKGWRLVYQPRSVVIHYESQSGPERFRRARQNIERLHSQWLEKIRPDLIITGDGSSRETGAVLAPYLTRAEEPEIVPKDAEPPLSVSIIILTWNQSAFTQECLTSIERHTPEPHEVIIVDNGSTDGTVTRLRELVKSRQHYSLIENNENLGFSHGCNQGIEASKGRAILLLNNDTVVTPGWLSGLQECLDSGADVGIVGPMTNSISGIQMVPAVGYSDTAGLDAYAVDFRKKYRGRRIPLRRIVGFCMLFRRELAERVGLLDERFGSGNFEDDDYCLRAALEGYRNLVAGDVFIHHHGSATFRGNGIDFTKAMSGNHACFNRKWSGPFTDEALAKQVLTLKTLEKAEVFFHKGEPDKGIETILQEGIKLIPSEERFYFFLAGKLIEEKRYQDALGVLGELPSDRQKDRALLLGAYAREGLGDIAAARVSLEAAHLPDGLQAPAYNLLGVLANHEGDPVKADELFRKAVRCDPGFAESYTNLGVMAWSENKQAEAVDLLERGFLVSPSNPYCAESFHAVLPDTDDLDRGISAFREARRLFPQIRRISFLLIDLLIRKSEIENALAMIQEAIVEFGLPEGLIDASLPLREACGPRVPEDPHAPASLSVCMIAKNEEENLPRCLSSLLNLADEIIVVDTGSSDRTREVAGIFGAKVLDFPWNGDFSAARNESLEHASCRWILVMDADEVLSPLDHGRLKALLADKAAPPNALAIVSRNYMLQVNREKWQSNDGLYPLEEAAGGWVPSTKVRIFPNRMGIIFENPIHEIVEPSLERIGVHVTDCDIPVHHYGFLDEARIREKKVAYYELGIRKLAEKGEDLKALYELAVQAGELLRHEEAAELWKRALALNPRMDVAWFNLGYNLLMLSRFEESRNASRKALELKPGYREVITNLAMCELCIGSTDEAVSLLETSLAAHGDDPNTVLMTGVSLVCAGRKEDAKAHFSILRDDRIDFTGFVNQCAEKLLTADKVDSARRLLNLMQEEGYQDNRSEELLREIAA
jgi:GT2 family glycosyltransferase/Flp pilus assembly protein TadD